VNKRKLSDCYSCCAKVRLLAQHYQQQGPLKTWNQSGLRQRQETFRIVSHTIGHLCDIPYGSSRRFGAAINFRSTPNNEHRADSEDGSACMVTSATSGGRSTKSQAVTYSRVLPCVRPLHHSATANEYCPSSSTVARHLGLRDLGKKPPISQCKPSTRPTVLRCESRVMAPSSSSRRCSDMAAVSGTPDGRWTWPEPPFLTLNGHCSASATTFRLAGGLRKVRAGIAWAAPAASRALSAISRHSAKLIRWP
jgi:hypothetical protein